RAPALLEAVLDGLTEAHDPGHIDLSDRPGVRDRLLALEHVVGDAPPHRAERHGRSRKRGGGGRRRFRRPGGCDLPLLAVRRTGLPAPCYEVFNVLLADTAANA